MQQLANFVQQHCATGGIVGVGNKDGSRIRVDCQYDGTNFSGWSIQPDRRSVQGVIEDVFSRVLDYEITTTVAGRTDAGVHALGQVFHFDLPETLRANWNLDSLLYIANRILTSEIRIVAIGETSKDFHARYSALRRRYRYQLLDDARTLNPLERVATASYHRPLDEQLMNAASALLLGEILAETDLPAGSWSVIPVGNEAAPGLVADVRLPVVSFTGSDKVGFEIQKAVPSKHITLELGGNAAAVVLEDWNSEKDMTWAASRIATFANYQAGQSCISVQRVLIHDSIFEEMTNRIVAAVAALPNGDPRDEKTVVGPMINEAAAIRVEEWVNEAVAGGAKVLTGGKRNGSYYEPTVLADVAVDAKVSCNEVFGPVMLVNSISSTQEGFDIVNDSPFGLQAGVFTHDVQTAFLAHSELEVGGVIIGDVPTFRSDQMPYGGVKASGVGKEGLLHAMRDLTHERILVLSDLAL